MSLVFITLPLSATMIHNSNIKDMRGKIVNIDKDNGRVIVSNKTFIFKKDDDRILYKLKKIDQDKTVEILYRIKGGSKYIIDIYNVGSSDKCSNH